MHRIAWLSSSRQFEFCKSEEIFVIVCVLRTAESFIIWNYKDPLTLKLINSYLNLAISSGSLAYYVIQRNDTTNEIVFIYRMACRNVSKILGINILECQSKIENQRIFSLSLILNEDIKRYLSFYRTIFGIYKKE